jgi:hypothetical protein
MRTSSLRSLLKKTNDRFEGCRSSHTSLTETKMDGLSSEGDKILRHFVQLLGVSDGRGLVS